MLDISTVGAGGGTIARVDENGRLLVGPMSAGASPGPAAYGRGGNDATSTDADVVLDYLSADSPLAGAEVRLDKELALQAVQEKVADPLGMDVEEAALAIARVNDAHMADAVRVLASKKRVELADSTLVACGGAGTTSWRTNRAGSRCATSPCPSYSRRFLGPWPALRPILNRTTSNQYLWT